MNALEELRELASVMPAAWGARVSRLCDALDTDAALRKGKGSGGEGIGIKGRVTIRVEREGTPDQIIRRDNLIVDAGKGILRDMILGTGFWPKAIAVGTVNTAPVVGDTALGNEVFRKDLTRRSATGLLPRLDMFLAQSEANGDTLVEAGLFDSTASLAGNLFSRVTHQDIIKDIDTAVTYAWEFTLWREDECPGT